MRVFILGYLNKWGWIPPYRNCLEWGTGIHRVEWVEVRSQGVTALYRYIPHKSKYFYVSFTSPLRI